MAGRPESMESGLGAGMSKGCAACAQSAGLLIVYRQAASTAGAAALTADAERMRRCGAETAAQHNSPYSRSRAKEALRG